MLWLAVYTAFVSTVLPGGGILVYSSDRLAGNPSIFMMNVNHLLLFRLTGIDSSDMSPSWSPDGQQIVVVSENHEIYVMNAVGSNQRRLTWWAGYDLSPAWRP
jgi:TolB protein